MAALREVHRLMGLARGGHVLAAMELAEIYKVASLKELLGVVCPNELPSPVVFDCCADAWALRSHQNNGRKQ